MPHPTYDFDVIVVGLGTAGAIAAIASAKRGLRVLGIERLSAMGGTGTTGGVLKYYFGSTGGMYEDVDRKAQQVSGSIYTPAIGIGAESKQFVLEEEALQAGVVLHYDTTVIDVIRTDKRLRGVACFSPERGKYTQTCQVVIDCTGNADLCRMSGCKIRTGRQLDGMVQPFSNVLFKMERDHVRTFYMDSGYVHTTDPLDLSNKIMDSALSPAHLRSCFGENDYFRIAPQIGIRESCHIEGETNVTLSDILENRATPEPVFWAFSNLDNHGIDFALESSLLQDWSVNAGLWGMKLSVPIPLEALIPEGYDRLLVAGRCLAVDHDLASCVRMKRDMQKCGEAAAVAAYIAIRDQISLRKVPYGELSALLRETGCLDDSQSEEARSARSSPGDVRQWMTSIADIQAGLASDSPAIAIWSAKRIGAELGNTLISWMEQADEEHLRKHSAIALALIDRQEAATVLLEMVRERDSFIPGGRSRFHHARGYTAVCLLGRLAHQAAIPELVHILQDSGLCTGTNGKKGHHPSEEDEQFQYVSHAIVALIRIGDRHPDSRLLVSQALVDFQARPTTEFYMSLWGNSHFSLNMGARLREVIEQALLRWSATNADSRTQTDLTECFGGKIH
ncbi:FAD-dependent oxidoreductase [Paenibacillus hemerocallicola]|nr:FAD-dependent oxidoreductase [Paenibacillus hemerocallicola]